MLITSFSIITVRVLTALPTTLLLVSTQWTVPSMVGAAFSTATPAYGIKHRHCPAVCCVPDPAPAIPLPTLVVKGLTNYVRLRLQAPWSFRDHQYHSGEEKFLTVNQSKSQMLDSSLTPRLPPLKYLYCWQFSLEHVPQTFGSQQHRCLNRRLGLSYVSGSFLPCR